MRSVSLRLEPGSNTVTLVTPSDYNVFLDDLVELIEPSLGPLQKAGSRSGITFYAGAHARPVTMRVLSPTPQRMSWYQKLGSPVGPEPQFVSLSIDWRRTSSIIVSWESETWVAPQGSIAVRGAANWPDLRTAAEYRSWLGETKTAETLSQVASTVDQAVEGAKEAAGSVGQALFWPLALGGVVAVFLVWGKLSAKD